jgi:hypothetical protein
MFNGRILQRFLFRCPPLLPSIFFNNSIVLIRKSPLLKGIRFSIIQPLIAQYAAHLPMGGRMAVGPGSSGQNDWMQVLIWLLDIIIKFS